MGKTVFKPGITFREIMEYYPDNERYFKEIVKIVKAGSYNIVPFVGAGMSVPIFPLWGECLKQISDKFTKEDYKKKVVDLVEKYKYEEAAQFLEDKRSKSKLRQDFEEIFSNEIIQKNKSQIRKMAVDVLPDLFNGLVVTTNIDGILEEVYETQNSNFSGVYLPGEREDIKTENLRDPGAHYLYKFHGTIDGGGKLAYENTVFTGTQYDKHYTEGSKLVKLLKEFFTQKIVLFLGCSLEKDRTLEVLKSAMEPGITNYAIVSCKPDRLDERAKELGDLGINAILYPDGKHEAVREILEQLLADVNNEAYAKLKEHVAAEAIRTEELFFDTRFSYDSSLYETVGRERELEKLLDFVNSDRPFSWWGILGMGGIGKSRVAFSFANNLPQGWDYKYIKEEDYENGLSSITSFSANMLLIADYVAVHAKELGCLIKRLSNGNLGCKVRLLLLERESGNWLDDMKSQYKGNALAEGTNYGCAEGFLCLEPLSDVALVKIMRMYSKAVVGRFSEYKRELQFDVEGMRLLKKLKEVDPELRRPLFALFLVDLWMLGDDPLRWDHTKIINSVMGREERLIDTRISREIGRNSRFLNEIVRAFLRVATAFQNVKIHELKELLPDEWNKLDNYVVSQGFFSNEEFISQVELSKSGTVLAIRPDILGEYYVLRWLLDNGKSDEKNQFFEILWTKHERALDFIYRLVKDYGEMIDKSQDTWKQLVKYNEEWPIDTLSSISCVMSFAIIVTKNEEIYQYMSEGQRVLYENNATNPTFVYAYADGLRFAIMFHDNDIPRILTCFENLYHRHRKNEIIGRRYADSLADALTKQSKGEAYKSYRELQNLSYELPDDAYIANAYVRGLVNIAGGNKDIDIEWVDSEVERLYSKFDNVEIATGFSLFMAQLVEEEKIGIGVKRLQKIRCIYTKYNNRDIATAYSIAMACLAQRSTNKRVLAMLYKGAVCLLNDYPNDQDIAVMCATILSKVQVDLKVYEELIGVVCEFPQVEAIVNIYSSVGAKLFLQPDFFDYDYLINLFKRIYSNGMLNKYIVNVIGRTLADGIVCQRTPFAISMLKIMSNICMNVSNRDEAPIYLAYTFIKLSLTFRMNELINATIYSLLQMMKANFISDLHVAGALELVIEAVDKIRIKEYSLADSLKAKFEATYLIKTKINEK